MGAAWQRGRKALRTWRVPGRLGGTTQRYRAVGGVAWERAPHRGASPSPDLAEVEHLAGAGGTAHHSRRAGGALRGMGVEGRVDRLRAVGRQVRFGQGKAEPLPGMEQTVGPHLLEAAGQHVLEEAAEERLGGERRGLSRLGRGVPVPEGEVAVLEREEVAVAEGHAKKIRGQVLPGGLAAAHRDEVHDPVLVPALPGDLGEQAGRLEPVAECGPEELGQGLLRHEEGGSGRSPRGAVRAEPAPGAQGVHLRGVTQFARPAVQNADPAEEAPEVLRIGRERLESRLGGLEEQGVNNLLVAPSQTAQAPRQGEGGGEVRDGQEEGSLLIAPAIGLVGLTLGAGAVLAGVGLVMLLLALGAAVQLPAQGLGPTGTEVLDGPPVAGEQPVVVLGERGRAMPAEEVRQFRHPCATDPP